jgi:hypothetical protein
MKFPKQPNGPSGPGAAGVRSLLDTGADFTTRRGPGFVARVKDGFSRVEVTGGPVYTAAGRVGDAIKVAQAEDPRQNFRPSHLAYGISADLGFAVSHVLNSEAQSNHTATYTYANADPEFGTTDYPIVYVRRTMSWTINIGRTDKVDAPQATFTFATQLQQNLNNVRECINRTVDLCYFGRVIKNGKADIGVGAYYLAPGSRSDNGKAMLDVVAARIYRDAPPEAARLAMPFGDREYLPPRAIASSGCIYVIVFEALTGAWLGPRDTSRDYRPPVWLLTSTNNGDSWTYRDIHVPAMDGAFMTLQQVGYLETIVDDDEPPATYTGFFRETLIPLAANGAATISDTTNYSYTSNPITQRDLDGDGDLDPDFFFKNVDPFYPFQFTGLTYDRGAAVTANLMALAMLEDDVVILAFPFLRELQLYDKFRVVRISDHGATVETVFTSPDDPEAEFYYFQSMVYAGKGTLIAKKVDSFGFVTVPANVKFSYSTDSGATWTDVSPTGLPSPLVSLNYGNLTVEKAATDSKAATVLMPCYDTAEGAYFVFATKDNGATWKRRGKILEAPFERVDTMQANMDERGGNFENLTPIATSITIPTPAVDRVLPQRYKRSA